MSKSKPILVVGGTGFLGSYLLRYLVKKGYHDIRALKRASSQMDLVEEIKDKVQWIEGDVLDIFSLEDAMEGVSKVYHCAAMISYDGKGRKQMRLVNSQGTANVVNAAQQIGIEKLLYVSSISAIGKKINEPNITERNTWQNNTLATQYGISKFLGEQEVWRGIQEGLNAVIINPSIILGSGFWENNTCVFFEEVWKGLRFHPMGTSGFVDVRDVARLMIELMDSNISNERYIVNGENLSYKSLFSEIALHLNKKPPSIKLTSLIQNTALPLAWIASKLTGKKPVITKETMKITSQTFFYNNQKSIKDLGFTYTPISQTIQETCLQFQEAKKNNKLMASLPLQG